MSRIGRQEIIIPSNITTDLQEQVFKIKGPKGELSFEIPSALKVIADNQKITVSRLYDHKFAKALHGLYRTLIQNAVIGVTKGFEKKLEIQGVGFKVQLQGKKLIFNLGFSHPVEIHIPPQIEVKLDPDKKNLIEINGIDKAKVGQFAANIRNLKKPEPYKGKGIRYFGEVIKRKAGKAASKEKS